MSILNVNKINPVGGGSTITIAGIASVTSNLTAIDITSTNISVGSSVTTNEFYGDQIKLGDNKKILLGEGNDIEIYHTGAVDMIEGKSLYLIQESQNIILRNLAGDEAYAKFFGNGAVELYHNGTKKLDTTSSGITVTGTVTDSKGELRNFPQVSVSSNRVLVSSDAGKHIINTGSGGWTINTSSGFSVGDVIRIINASDSSQILYQAGGVTTYSRRDGGVSGDHSIVDRGAAIIICTGSNQYYVSGDI